MKEVQKKIFLNKKEILFQDIPVSDDERIQKLFTIHTDIENMTLKFKIKCKVKNKILKPIYHLIANISPSMAIKLKVYVYELRNTLFEFRNKKDPESLKIMANAKILIDCTNISKCDIGTGIQRVVKNILFNLPDNFIASRLYSYNKLITNKSLQKKGITSEEYLLDIKNTEKIVFLDSSWENKDDFYKIISSNKICTYFVVYDILPIKYPMFFNNKLFVKIFTDWHDMALKYGNNIICISQSVADDIVKYFQEKNIFRREPLKIYNFPLGANFIDRKNINTKFVRRALKNFVSNKTFLMVGTIEPRKGHMIALKAIINLVNQGENVKLLIIGKNGWKSDEFTEFISKSEYNKINIMWIEDASDYELIWAYQNSCALIAASLDEGYGLPIIEAAQFKLPIICSDIPVFHEVTQNLADFFKPFDSDDLALTIKKWIKNNRHPNSSMIRLYTWEEAANIFADIVNDKIVPYKILK